MEHYYVKLLFSALALCWLANDPADRVERYEVWTGTLLGGSNWVKVADTTTTNWALPDTNGLHLFYVVAIGNNKTSPPSRVQMILYMRGTNQP